jgi:DNA-binding response OmpR family regulator
VKVWVVEDEERLADTLAKGLRRNGFAVDVAYDGASGWERIAEGSYDVVVLDRDLPVVHGDEVCTRTVAQRPDTRVLMLTASSSTEDLVVGLGLGADDYLGKPFAFDELLARIHALGAGKVCRRRRC